MTISGYVILCMTVLFFVFVFKQKTAYEMRISDWSSDVCSSDLLLIVQQHQRAIGRQPGSGLEIVGAEPCRVAERHHRVLRRVGRAATIGGNMDAGDRKSVV